MFLCVVPHHKNLFFFSYVKSNNFFVKNPTDRLSLEFCREVFGFQYIFIPKICMFFCSKIYCTKQLCSFQNQTEEWKSEQDQFHRAFKIKPKNESLIKINFIEFSKSNRSIKVWVFLSVCVWVCAYVCVSVWKDCVLNTLMTKLQFWWKIFSSRKVCLFTWLILRLKNERFLHFWIFFDWFLKK